MGAVRSGVRSGAEEPGSPCARDDKVGWDRGISMGDFLNQKNSFLQNQNMRGSGLISTVERSVENRQLGASTSSTTLEETTQPGFGPGLCSHSKNLVSGRGGHQRRTSDAIAETGSRLERLQRSTAHLDLAGPVRGLPAFTATYTCVHSRYQHGRSIAGPHRKHGSTPSTVDTDRSSASGRVH